MHKRWVKAIGNMHKDKRSKLRRKSLNNQVKRWMRNHLSKKRNKLQNLFKSQHKNSLTKNTNSTGFPKSYLMTITSTIFWRYWSTGETLSWSRTIQSKKRTLNNKRMPVKHKMLNKRNDSFWLRNLIVFGFPLFYFD